MSHPLAPKLDELTMDELTKKLSELHKKFNFASQTNHHLANQIFFLIDDYQNEWHKRLIEQDEEMLKELGEDFFTKSIDIG